MGTVQSTLTMVVILLVIGIGLAASSWRLGDLGLGGRAPQHLFLAALVFGAAAIIDLVALAVWWWSA